MDEGDEIDPFLAHHEGLLRVHGALAGAVGALVRSVTGERLVPHARDIARFLLGHHAAEDEVLFPGLRRSSRLRTTDVAFLDACDAQHRRLHALCDRLRAEASAAYPREAEVRAIATELEAALEPHLRDEEAGLAPGRLREMIDRAALEALGRELEARRA